MTCLSMPYSSVHLIRVAEHLGVETPGVPATPFRALMAGVNPGPVPVHRALQHYHRHNSRPSMSTGRPQPSMNCAKSSTIRHLSLHTTHMQQPVLSSTRRSHWCTALASECRLTQGYHLTEKNHRFDVVQIYFFRMKYKTVMTVIQCGFNFFELI